MIAHLIAKPLAAAAALAAAMTLALPASQAKADVDVQIGIGTYVPAYDQGGYGRYEDDDYGDEDYGYGSYGESYGYGYRGYRYRDHRVSCGMGRNIVDRAGFNRVRPVDCSAPNYRYTAWKHGHRYVVRVSPRGEITRIKRVF